MIAAEWKSCKLGDVVTLQRGFDLPKNKRKEGSVPIVSSSGVSGYHDTAKVAAPGVVTGRYGTLGEVFHIKKEFWPLNTTLYVRDFKGNDPLFVSYFLQTLNLAHQNAAGAVPGLNRNALHLLPVRVPPLPTQRKVASILSSYDDLIENNTRRIEILEEIAGRIYQEWFIHFRFPGHRKVGMVESELGLIPEGWEAKSLGEVCSFISRGVAPKYDDESESIVVNQKCVRNGRLNLDLARRHSKRVPPEKLIRFGDGLINSTGVGTLGRVTQVYSEIEKTTVDSHVSIVRSGDQLKIDFFGLALLNLQTQFENLGQGATGQTELNRQSIANTLLVVPNVNTQEAFAEIVAPMRKEALLLGITNGNLRSTRNLLLPKLISGEVDVEDVGVRSES